ncbi:MAG: VCBS repeat-containing protein, partial [Betaproteobacteria bacterium]|nr:VCBS repeat-containing protein [Betaproteobacteria bacterium]
MYRLDGADYVAADGAGHDERMRLDAGKYVAYGGAWGDGGAQIRFNETDGRLASMTDAAGNTLSFEYEAGLLKSATTANNEKTVFSYAGNNLTELWTEIKDANNQVKIADRIRYEYDSLNRLKLVKVDLSPEDDSVSDGNVYVTNYSYDGNSNRVASIGQTDGTLLAIEYVQVGSEYRVKSLTNALQQRTQFSYDTASQQTVVADATGAISTLHYDGKGQLTKLVGAPVGGISTTQEFTYDANGNVLKVTEQAVRVVDAGSRRDVNGAGWSRNGIGTSNYAIATDGTLTASRLQSNGTLFPAGRGTTVLSPAGKTYQVTAMVRGNGGPAQFQLTLTSLGFVDYASPDFVVGTDWQKVSFSKTFAAGDTGIFVTAFKKSSSLQEFDLLISDLTVEEIEGSPRFIEYGYDARGNQILQRDGLGNTLNRTYSANNLLLSETAYSTPDPDGNGAAQPTGALITRYVYGVGGGANNQLRFVISPEGRVSEYRYDTYGQRTAAIQYAGSSLASAAHVTLADFESWAAQSSVAQGPVLYTAYEHDARGQLKVERSYDAVSGLNAAQVNGTGLAETTYVFDQRGGLLQSITKNGPQVDVLNSFTYDGLGRVTVSTTGPSTVVTDTASPEYVAKRITRTIFDDSHGVTREELATGEKIISAFDAAGRLVSRLRSQGAQTLQATTYDYDAMGRLLMSSTRDELSPPGQVSASLRSWTLYDAAGRKIADIDADGSFVEYVYDKSGLLSRTIAYANRVNTSLLTDANGKPTQPALASIRPATSASDIQTWNAYDGGGRLSKQVDAQGAVTEYVYDGASRITATIRYANTILTSALGAAPKSADIVPLVSAADRVSRSHYDKDGLLKMTVDGEGYAVEYRYDSAGQLVEKVKYANRLAMQGLLWLNATTGQTYGYNVNGLTVTSEGSGHVSYDPLWKLAGTGDMDGDGVSDLLWHHSGTGQVKLSRLAGDGSVRATQETVFYTEANLNWKIVGTADLNADGKADIVWRNEQSGHVFVMLMNGAQIIGGSTAYHEPNLAWKIVALGDFDGDRKADILYRNDQTGQNYILMMDGLLAKPTPTSGFIRTIADQQWKVAAIGDFDGDQKADILWRHAATGENYIYFMNGLNIKSTEGSTRIVVDTGNWQVKAVGDFDGDTKSDLVWHHGSTGQTYVYFMDGKTIKSTEGTLRYVSDTNWKLAGGVQLQGTSYGQPVPIANASADQRTRFIYNAKGQRVGEVDAEGYLTETEYSPAGQITKVTRYENKANVITSASVTLQAVRPQLSPGRDHVTTYVYDALDRLITQVNAEGTITSYRYDEKGNLVSTVFAAGSFLAQSEARSSLFRYDAFGRVTAELSAEGAAKLSANPADPANESIWNQYSIKHTYDGFGQRTSTTDQNGLRTLFYYDLDGNLSVTINALGEVRRSDYNGLEQLQKTTVYSQRIASTALTGMKGGLIDATLIASLNALANPQDTVTQYTYNNIGAVQTKTDALGFVSSTVYNAFGEVSEWLDPISATQSVRNTRTYDRRGLKAQTTLDAGTGVAINASQTNEFDAFGRLIRFTDANQRIQTATFDRLGRQVSATGRSGTTHYTYDAFSRVVTEAGLDNPGTLTTYTYDLAARSVVMTTPEGVRVTTVRNRHGEVVLSVDGRGVATHTTYDENGRAKGTWVDGLDSVTGTANPNAESSSRNVYDRGGRLLDSYDARGVRTRYMYDDANRQIARIVDPHTIDGVVVNGTGLHLTTFYEFDAKGQQVTVFDPNMNAVRRHVYDQNGQLKEIRRGEGGVEVTRYTYDAQGRVLTVQEPEGNRTQYVYDALGRRIAEIVDPSDGSAVPPYIGMNLTTRYRFDKEGNVIQKLEPNAGTVGEGFKTRYVYDDKNRLAFVIDALGYVSETRYDDRGRVIEQIRYEATVPMTEAAPNPDWLNMVAWYTNNGALARTTTRSVYDADGRLAYAVDATRGLTAYRYDAAGNLVERRELADALPSAQGVTKTELDAYMGAQAAANIRRTQFVLDALGRMRFTIDGAGSVTERRYDKAGNVVETLGYFYGLAGADRDLAMAGPGVGYANQVQAPLSALASKMSSGLGGLAFPARDRHSWHFYDLANRNTVTVDGAGSVSESQFDKNGNLLGVRRYATGLAMSDSKRGELSALTAQSVITAQALNVQQVDADARVFHYYDAANRLKSTVTVTRTWRENNVLRMAGSVVDRSYDRNGNLTNIAQRSEERLSLPWETVEWKQMRTSEFIRDTDRVVRRIYDKANRLILEADPSGAVTRTQYDESGNVQSRTVHANRVVRSNGLPYDGNSVSDTDIKSVIADVTNDRVERWVHDAKGRVLYHVDARGFVTGSKYDELDRLKESIAYQTAVNLGGTELLGAIEGAVAAIANLNADRKDAFTYDAMGRLVASTDALGKSETFSYDALGNKLSFTNKSGATWTYAYDAMGRMTEETAPSVATTSVAKIGGKWVASTSNAALKTHYSYNAFGQLSGRTESSQVAHDVVPKAASESVEQAVLRIAFGNAKLRGEWETQLKQVNSAFEFKYRQAGRYVQPAQGLTQSQTEASLAAAYAALFDSNAPGKVMPTTGGQIAFGAVLPNGDRQAVFTATNGNSYTFYKLEGAEAAVSRVPGLDLHFSGFSFVSKEEGLYVHADHVGLLTSELTSAVTGTGPIKVTSNTGQRLTSYMYDLAGRQIRTMLPFLAVSSTADADLLAPERREEVKVPEINVTYDALGRAVMNLDVMGNRTFRTYDPVGRVRFEVDAEGHVTEHRYNVFGEETDLVRYASQWSGMAGRTSPVSTDELASWASVNAANSDNRVINTAFDRTGRVASVREGNVAQYFESGSLINFQAEKRYEYNAHGQVKKLTQTVQHGSATQTETDYFYDRAGNKIREVDALGHRTDLFYDAAGSLIKQIEYSQVDVTRGAGQPVQGDKDRVVEYVHDKMGRKIVERRVGLDYATVDNAGQLNQHNGQVAETRYAYDALGNLTQTTDATGAVSFTVYDAQGRRTAVIGPMKPPVDGAAAVDAAVTEFRLDNYGNVLEQIQYQRGAAVTSADGALSFSIKGDFNNKAAGATSADRATWSKYDNFGRLIESVDARGDSRYYSYNAQGQLVKEWQSTVQFGAGGTSVNQNIVKTYTYDKTGKQLSAAVIVGGRQIATRNAFNAFGEITEKRVVDASLGAVGDTKTEYYKYDQLGRLWATNAGDGIDKVWLYDTTGARSAEYRSAGSIDLSLLPSAASVTYQGAAVTSTQYTTDLLGRVTAERAVVAREDTGANWVPNEYLAFRDVIESAWDTMSSRPVNDPESWGSGTLTRTAGSMAVYRDHRGAETRFDLDEGPLVAIKKSDAFRRDAEARVNSQRPPNALQFAFNRSYGSYIPQNYRDYRVLEPGYFGYFTDMTLYPLTGANNPPIDWMGGKLTKLSATEAKLVRAGKPDFFFTRDEGPLSVMRRDESIRKGWQRDHNLELIGDGGETVVNLKPRVSDSGSSHPVRLDWGNIGRLGSGDVKVSVQFVGGTVVEHVYASFDAERGVNFNRDGASGSVEVVRLYKKDIFGKWHELDGEQIFTIDSPSNPTTHVEVQVHSLAGTQILVTDTTGTSSSGLVNFGDRILVRPAVSGEEQYSYTVRHTTSGAATPTVVASGVMSTLPLELEHISLGNLQMDSSTGILSWGAGPAKSFYVAPGVETTEVRARAVYYRPDNYANFKVLENSFYAFFDSTTEGQRVENWGEVGGQRYDIVRGEGDTAYLVKHHATNMEAGFRFTRSEGVLSVAWRSDIMRQRWQSYDGYPLQFVQDVDAVLPSVNAEKLLLLEAEFDSLFTSTSVPIGMQTGWGSLVLVKTSDHTFSFTDSNGKVHVLDRNEGPLKLINQSSEARNALQARFGITFAKGAWSGPLPMVGSNANTANFSNLDTGNYQYEILFSRGNKPYGHSVGFARVDKGWGGGSVGSGQHYVAATGVTGGPSTVQWTVTDPSIATADAHLVAEISLREKINGELVGNYSAPIAVSRQGGNFSVDLSSFVAAGTAGETRQFAFKVEYKRQGVLRGVTTGTVTTEAQRGGQVVFESQDVLTPQIVSRSVPNPDQFKTQDIPLAYSSQVVEWVDHNGYWYMRPGYHAPIVGYEAQEGGALRPVYGQAVGWGSESIEEIIWPHNGLYPSLRLHTGQNNYQELPLRAETRVVNGQSALYWVADLNQIQSGAYNYVLEYYDQPEEPSGGLLLGPEWSQVQRNLVAYQQGTVQVTQGTMGGYAPSPRPVITASNPITTQANAPYTEIRWLREPGHFNMQFKYRAAGAASWSTLQPWLIANPGVEGGIFTVSIPNLGAGNYEYQIEYTTPDGVPPPPSGQSNVFARTTGTLTVEGTVAGWQPPEGHLAGLTQQYNNYFNTRQPGNVEFLSQWTGWGWNHTALIRGTSVDGVPTAHMTPYNGLTSFSRYEGVQGLMRQVPHLVQHFGSEYGIQFTEIPARWVPSWSDFYTSFQNGMNSYFQDTGQFPVGSSTPIWNGTLTRLSDYAAQYDNAGGGSYVFYSWVPVEQVVMESAMMRELFGPAYGVSFTYEPASYSYNNYAGYARLEADFNAFFDSIPAGGVVSGNGHLIRVSGQSAYYTASSLHTFNRAQGPLAAAQGSADVRALFAQWGYPMTYQSGTVGPGRTISANAPAAATTSPGLSSGLQVTRISSGTYGSGGLPRAITLSPDSRDDAYRQFAALQNSYGQQSTSAADTPKRPLSLPPTNAATQARIVTSTLQIGSTFDTLSVVNQTYDRWGNVLSKSDARNATWTTQYEYNDFDQLVAETKPQVRVTALHPSNPTNPNSIHTEETTVTRVYYDQLGRSVGVKDANGYLNRTQYDARGNVVKEWHADGGVVEHSYDALGQRVSTTDAVSNTTRFAYDQAGQLAAVVRPEVKVVANVNGHSMTIDQGVLQHRVDSFHSDAAGRRITSTNGAGETTRYAYDERGLLLTETRMLRNFYGAEGLKTTYEYDQFGNKTKATRTNAQHAGQSDVESWSYRASENAATPWLASAAFGRLIRHVNLGGETRYNLYDQRGLVTEQQKFARGPNADQLGARVFKTLNTYDHAGRLTKSEGLEYVPNVSTPQVKSNTVSHYDHDAAGNKVTERLEKDGVVYQDNRLFYDAQNRLNRILDSRHDVTIAYDAAGNRRSVVGYFYDDGGGVKSANNWYAYDEMNRMTLENGVPDGDDDINVAQGIRYEYDRAGNKIKETKFGKLYNVANANGSVSASDVPVTHDYRYDAENRLVEITQATPDQTAINTWEHADGQVRDGTAPVKSNVILARQYDAAGRVVDELTVNLNKQGHNVPTNGGDDRGDRVFSIYDDQGRLNQQISREFQGGIRYSTNYAGGYDAFGNLKSYNLIYRPGKDGSFTEATSITHQAADGYRETSVTTVRNNQLSQGGYSTFTYNAAGHLQQVVNAAKSEENRRFITDGQGNVLRRFDGQTSLADTAPLTIGQLRQAGVAADRLLRHYL